VALSYLLDTDVIIWHLRGHDPTQELLREIESQQPLGCSTISMFEVWCGVRPKEKEATLRLLNALLQIPADGEIAVKAAEYWREFRRRGVTLGQGDALIAATANTLRLTLVTYSRDHYPMKDIAFYSPMPRIE